VVLSKSNLSRLADRLEDAGLIERQDCPEDRRGYDLLLTRAGRAMRKKMWPVYEARIKELFSSHLSVEEARVIGEALGRAVKAARDGKIPA
jgi:DNA-binding MarR family transcriptional regulator